MHPGLGRELDERLLPGFRLARPEGRTARRCGELCTQSEPMSCAAAIRGARRQEMAIAGSTQLGQLRMGRRFPARTRPVPGYGSLAGMRVFRFEMRIVGVTGPF